MVRVPILVREGTLRFRVSVQARSIRRAVEIAAARYPGANVRVSFPIDAETFFVEEHSSWAAHDQVERPKRMAA